MITMVLFALIDYSLFGVHYMIPHFGSFDMEIFFSYSMPKLQRAVITLTGMRCCSVISARHKG